MAFNGYLIKANGANDPFPNKYIAKTTYKISPNKHTVLKEYREDNTSTLHRILATGRKTSITFETIKLDRTDAAAIVSYFETNASDLTNQTIVLSYYNPRTDAYATGTFYFNDLLFNINYTNIGDLDVYMAPVTITLEEF